MDCPCQVKLTSNDALVTLNPLAKHGTRTQSQRTGAPGLWQDGPKAEWVVDYSLESSDSLSDGTSPSSTGDDRGGQEGCRVDLPKKRVRCPQVRPPPLAPQPAYPRVEDSFLKR